ncbi:hypothetical protein B0H13DRAFT_2306004 [Mycena leptocephala]|nr:hypothetical protein B0H13DRAFT_2317732 [Mycena leptocephala]KAJ7934274.1 hypothetical protein B0H13DRAFT_2306004 [Mycena leptocephala]
MDSSSTAGPSSGRTGPSDTSGSGDPQAGGKRTADDRGSPLEDRPQAAKKSRKGGKKKQKPKQFHLTKEQVPKEFLGLKNCIFLHGYIAYMITRSDVPPPLPGAALITAHERIFEPKFLAALDERLRTTSTRHVGAGAMVKALRDKATADLSSGSQIAKHILDIGEPFLLTIFSAILHAGLEKWCPDINSPPDTLYNRAHEIVFVQTFHSVAIGLGYRSLCPTPAGINNFEMIKDLYHSYVFAYMKDKARVERAEAGKLAQNKEDNNAFRRLKRLSEKRVAYAIEDKLPDRVVALVGEPYCNSDDESGSDGEGNHAYIVSAKLQRGVSATTFVHKLEKRRLAFVLQQKGRRRTNLHERTRVRVEESVESDISYHMPKNAPIDYFDPEFFNDLPAKTRFAISKNGVALPLPQYHANKDWKTMPKTAFMAKYGNEVLKQYDIPTPEEMDGQGNSGWEEDEVEEEVMEED